MKTKNIESALRNATTPAAKLAAWQNKSLARRMAEIKAYHAGATLASARAACIASEGPELSSPEAAAPILWVSERSREVLDAFPGREFLDHLGWYQDDFQDETFETYAVQLARFPGLMFYAVKDSCSGDFRVMLEDWEEIDFSDAESEYQAGDCIQDAARAVVRSNDSSTEREAEECREYYRKDQAERDIAENRETLAAIRSEVRALAHELRQPGNRANPDAPLVRAACKNLRALLSDRRDLMEENETLAASI